MPAQVGHRAVVEVVDDHDKVAQFHQLIDKKGAFEWQQGVLTAWDGQVMKLTVNNQPLDFKLSPAALLFFRIGDDEL